MGHWSEMGSRSFSCLYRGTHRRCSIEKGVLKNFAKFTGKHLCQSLFFNEVADLGPATLLKKILLHRCFPVNFSKFLRAPYLKDTFGQLVLFVIILLLLTIRHIKIVPHQDNKTGDLSYLDKGKEVNKKINGRKAFS